MSHDFLGQKFRPDLPEQLFFVMWYWLLADGQE